MEHFRWEQADGWARVSPCFDCSNSLVALGKDGKERILKPKSCLAIYFGSGFTPRIETKTVDLHHQEQLEEGGGSDGTSLVTGMCWQEEGPGDREAV